MCTLCLSDWPTGRFKCYKSECPLSRNNDVDAIISFKIGAVFQLEDGTKLVVKVLRDNAVTSLALLTPTEAFDMCAHEFKGDMVALGEHLQAKMHGKQFEGLFTLRSSSSLHRLLKCCCHDQKISRKLDLGFNTCLQNSGHSSHSHFNAGTSRGCAPILSFIFSCLLCRFNLDQANFIIHLMCLLSFWILIVNRFHIEFFLASTSQLSCFLMISYSHSLVLILIITRGRSLIITYFHALTPPCGHALSMVLSFSHALN